MKRSIAGLLALLLPGVSRGGAIELADAVSSQPNPGGGFDVYVNATGTIEMDSVVYGQRQPMDLNPLGREFLADSIRHGAGRMRLWVDRSSTFGPVNAVLEIGAAAGVWGWDFALAPDGARVLTVNQPSANSFRTADDGVNPRAILTIHVATDSIWVGRTMSESAGLNTDDRRVREGVLKALLQGERNAYQDEIVAVLIVDHDLPFGEALRALDIAQAMGYTRTVLAGAPRRPTSPSQPPELPGSISATQDVRLDRFGGVRFTTWEGARAWTADSIDGWYQLCMGETCTLVAVSGVEAAALFTCARGSTQQLVSTFWGKPMANYPEHTPAPPPATTAAPHAIQRVVGDGSAVANTTGPIGLLRSSDSSDVNKTIRTRLSALDDCYTAALSGSPGLGGTLTLRFVILSSGRLEQVEAESWTGEGGESFLPCALGVVHELGFPPPSSGSTVSVRYPLEFPPG